MTKIFFLTILLPFTLANARQDKDRGGGDPCEQRIQAISQDIRKWILEGGAQDLELPSALTSVVYSDQMLEQIQSAKISCVGQGDPGHPVQIDGTLKVCRFDRFPTESRITCDANKFHQLDESSQYVLIHHEFAGLAKIENPKADVSDYTISNQINDLLVVQNRKGLGSLPLYAVELDTSPGITIPKQVSLILRSYLHNYCTYSLSSADAVLQTALVKKVRNNPVTGWTPDVRQISVTLELTFGSDDQLYVRDQKILLDNTNGTYEIKNSVGVCQKELRY